MILPEGYEAHPAATLIPLMADDELRALADDIKANGLRQPITLDGVNQLTGCAVVIDGRNRLAACALAGVRPEFKQFASYGDLEPVAWVFSQNLHRRNLNTVQRAELAVRAAELMREDSKSRMLSALKYVGPKAPSESLAQICASDRTGPESLAQICASDEPGKSLEKSAAIAGVSARTAESYRRVEQKGTPELLAATKAGTVSIDAASKVAVLPHEEQRELVAQGRKAVAAKARELREAKRTARHDDDLERPARPAEIVRFDKPAPAREALLERFARCVRHLREEAERFDELVMELGYLLDDVDGNADGFIRTIEDEIAQHEASALDDDTADEDTDEETAGSDGS